MKMFIEVKPKETPKSAITLGFEPKDYLGGFFDGHLLTVTLSREKAKEVLALLTETLNNEPSKE